MKNIPKTIYLNIGCITSDVKDFNELEEVTWNKDRVNADDIPYQLKSEWCTDLVPDFYSNILMKLNKNGKRIVTLGYIANGVPFSENRDLNIEKSDIIAWMPIPKFEIK